MPDWKTVGWIAAAFYGLVFLVLLLRTQRPGKVLFWYWATAIWVFLLVHLLGRMVFIELPVSPLNAAVTLSMGVPGLILILLLAQNFL